MPLLLPLPLTLVGSAGCVAQGPLPELGEVVQGGAEPDHGQLDVHQLGLELLSVPPLGAGEGQEPGHGGGGLPLQACQTLQGGAELQRQLAGGGGGGGGDGRHVVGLLLGVLQQVLPDNGAVARPRHVVLVPARRQAGREAGRDTGAVRAGCRMCRVYRVSRERAGAAAGGHLPLLHQYDRAPADTTTR